MGSERKVWTSRVAGLLREPTIHFFIIGALLFFAYRLVAGDPRTIVVSPGLRAHLERRLRDQNGRPPTREELGAALANWKRDEALYREALRERLDRDDPTIRTVLADKIRTRAALEVRQREPSDAELDEWLAQHREAYETPLRYDFELVAFPKADVLAQKHRDEYQRALEGGASVASLGRPFQSGTLTREQLQEKFGAALSEKMCDLSLKTWQPLEGQDSLLLVRVNGIDGGLPSRDVLRPRLLYDWETFRKKRAVEKRVEDIVARYRFEEKP